MSIIPSPPVATSAPPPISYFVSKIQSIRSQADCEHVATQPALSWSMDRSNSSHDKLQVLVRLGLRFVVRETVGVFRHRWP